MLSYSIIIPVYNKYKLTRACLLSLQQETKHDNFEVIVVDNASSDETQTEIPTLGIELFPERFTYIRNDENLNFSCACNQGAKAARAEYLCFLNNDTIMTENWDKPLIKALKEDSKLGAVGPVLLYENDTVQHIGGAIEPSGKIGHFYRYFPADHPVVRKKRKLNIITAAVLMIPKTNFYLAGAFNEAYKNGFEDVELCFKLRKLGFELSVIPESTVYHLEGQSPGRKDYTDHNSKILNTNFPEIVSDLHHILVDDGYEISLDSSFSLNANVSKEKERELQTKAALCKNTADFYTILDKEPYWQSGYPQLANLFIKVQDLSSAYRVYYKQAIANPQINTFYKMLALLNNLDMPELKNKLLATIEHHIKEKTPEYLSGLYEHNIKISHKYNDHILQNILQKWYHENSKILIAKPLK